MCLLVLLFAGLVVFTGYKKGVRPSEPQPVQIRRSLFYNGDSLSYYAALAYKDEDPTALYITAVASYLSVQDPNFPDSIHTVPVDEAEIMLLRAAELGQPDAISLIHCLDASGCWNHSVPQTLNDKEERKP
ncbi:MAG: hypothetical protein IJQ32_02395 [Paludibacteraceae bacterium]|nr:hypothetical protein [Paludibacteraceae bacterium]